MGKRNHKRNTGKHKPANRHGTGDVTTVAHAEPSWVWTAVCLVAILIVTLLTFASLAQAGFVNWDDGDYVVDNLVIRDLSSTTLRQMWSNFYVGCYMPLTMMSYAVEYRFGGLNSGVFHSTNVALHLLNCVLTFWFLHALTRRLPIATIVTFLFAIHPLHVESVAWISQRKDVLYASFFLAALLCYTLHRTRGTRVAYGAALAFFQLSLLSKPMAITLPVLLPLIDYLLRVKLSRRTMLDKLPFVALSLVFGVVALIGQHSASALDSADTGGPLMNVLAATYGVILYLARMVLPVKLSAIYPYPPELLKAAWYAPVLLTALAAGVLISARRTRTIVFGSLFFLIAIAPVLKLVPIGNAIVADRYTYVPSLGLFYMLAEGLLWIWNKHFAQRHLPGRMLAIAPLVGLAAALVATSRQRCTVWRDSITMWSDTIAKSDHVPPVAYNNRGQTYGQLGKPQHAIADLDEAIRRDPQYAAAYLNRGAIYHAVGDTSRAMADYTRAVELNPNLPQAHNNRGNIFVGMGQLDEAIACYNRALSHAPNFAEAFNGRGLSHARKGDISAALADYAGAVAANPFHYDAMTNRALLYRDMGRLDKALAEFTRALAIQPSESQIYFMRAETYRMKGMPVEALQDMQKATALGYRVDPHLLKLYHEAVRQHAKRKLLVNGQ